MDLSGVLSGGVAGSLHIEGDGDKIDVTPVLTSGEKIATIIINEGSEDEQVIDLYAPEGFSGSWNDLTDKPTLFSGVYADLTSKPTLNGDTINGNMYTDKYSSNEQRVGTWINGKPLYQKTFIFNQQVIDDNTWTNDILGTRGSGIEIVDYNGMFGLTDNPHFSNFSYYRSSTEYFTAYCHNNNGHNDDISVRPNMNAGANVTLDRCTILYVKDSDS